MKVHQARVEVHEIQAHCLSRALRLLTAPATSSCYHSPTHLWPHQQPHVIPQQLAGLGQCQAHIAREPVYLQAGIIGCGLAWVRQGPQRMRVWHVQVAQLYRVASHGNSTAPAHQHMPPASPSAAPAACPGGTAARTRA